MSDALSASSLQHVPSASVEAALPDIALDASEASDVFPDTEQMQRQAMAAQLERVPPLDRAKVDALRQQIESGQYPLSPRRIAERFAFHALRNRR